MPGEEARPDLRRRLDRPHFRDVLGRVPQPERRLQRCGARRRGAGGELAVRHVVHPARVVVAEIVEKEADYYDVRAVHPAFLLKEAELVRSAARRHPGVDRLKTTAGTDIARCLVHRSICGKPVSGLVRRSIYVRPASEPLGPCILYFHAPSKRLRVPET